jgi:DHA1 family tetracycline resistance protein-like MFS transporter
MDKKRISITFLIVLTNTIGATLILPMLPLYVEKQFRASPLQATLVIAAFYAAQFLAAPWLGKLSDRMGRRPILIISQIGTIAAYGLIVFVTPLGLVLERAGLNLSISGGLLVIYLARLLDGVTGGNISVAEAYASDISDEKTRTQALGLVGGANGVGHILGPAVAVLLSGISLIAPLVGAAVVSGITLLLTVILLDETLTPEKRAMNASAAKSSVSTIGWLSQRPVVLVLAAALAIGLYIAAVTSSFSLYAERVLFPNQPATVVVQNAGFIIMLMGLVVAFIQIFLIQPLSRWLGEQTLVVVGAGLLLVSAIGFTAANSMTGAVLAALAYSFGFAVSWPSLQSIMTRLGTKETVGTRLGLFQSAFSLALIGAPILAGLVMENIGTRQIFHVGGLLSTVGIVLGVILMHLPLSGNSRQASDSEAAIAVEKPAVQRGFLGRFH